MAKGDGTQGELFAIDEPATAPNDRRIFVDWSRPLLEHAVAFLASGWDEGILDLGALLVIVPTRHSGRRLREALAVHTANKGAVIPPLVVTPDFLVSPARLPDPATDAGVAGDAEALIAWIDSLRAIETRQFRHVFPVDPVERTFSWALHTASHLLNLRKLLAEAGLTVRDAARSLADGEMEPLRWRELARLEESALEKLAARNLLDPESTRIRAAREGVLPPEVDRIVVLGVADPLPLALHALERHARDTPAELLVYAPDDMRDLFDEWGRPVTGEWKDRRVDIPHAAETLHDAATPAAQAERVLELFEPYGGADPANTAAVCLPDNAVAAPLRKALERRNLGAFEPAGLSLQIHESFFLLDTLADLLKTRSVAAFAQLLRCPDFAKALQSLIADESALTHAKILDYFDALQAAHLPDTIDDAAVMLDRFRPPKSDRGPELIMVEIRRWLKDLQEKAFGDVLQAFLGFAYSTRRFRADRAEDRVFSAASDAVSRHLEAMQGAPFRHLENTERMDLLLHLLQSEKFYPEREPVDVDLQGWLELFWEDAPHVVITGFNDGQVPEAVVGDPYLPNTALARLGLRDNDHWLARDAYYLTAILESRRAAGRTDIIFGRNADDGSPLRPSRLLFHCPDDELPARALQLFHGEGGSGENPSLDAPAPWTRTWKLAPPPLPEPNGLTAGLRVTAFRSYLACPFRFYLSTGLGMREVELGKMEMNPMEFGNLIHDVLKRFGRNESLRDSQDADEIARFFTDEAESYVNKHYGDKRNVPVMIQLESARQRLTWAAEKQADLRREGWKIQEAEWQLHEPDPWLVHEMPVRGIIDRIDRHEETGTIRVIDYKTSSKPLSPREAHLSPFKRNDDPAKRPAWSKTADADDTPLAWTDLQLPLYVHAVRERLPGAGAADVECAYFNLPRAVAETSVIPWEDLDADLLAAAKRCAEGVIDAVRNREFWPPADSVPFDNYENIFFGNAAESVDETAFRRVLESPSPSPSPSPSKAS